MWVVNFQNRSFSVQLLQTSWIVNPLLKKHCKKPISEFTMRTLQKTFLWLVLSFQVSREPFKTEIFYKHLTQDVGNFFSLRRQSWNIPIHHFGSFQTHKAWQKHYSSLSKSSLEVALTWKIVKVNYQFCNFALKKLRQTKASSHFSAAPWSAYFWTRWSPNTNPSELLGLVTEAFCFLLSAK